MDHLKNVFCMAFPTLHYGVKPFYMIGPNTLTLTYTNIRIESLTKCHTEKRPNDTGSITRFLMYAAWSSKCYPCRWRLMTIELLCL